MMSMEASESSIAVARVRNILLVTMQPDLNAAELHDLSQKLASMVGDANPLAVVLDFSTVELLSFAEFERIRSMLLSLHLLGPSVAIVSLSCEIVIYLAEYETTSSEIQFFLGLDEAMAHYEAQAGWR